MIGTGVQGGSWLYQVDQFKLGGRLLGTISDHNWSIVAHAVAPGPPPRAARDLWPRRKAEVPPLRLAPQVVLVFIGEAFG
jgi:hypothetical protein